MPAEIVTLNAEGLNHQSCGRLPTETASHVLLWGIDLQVYYRRLSVNKSSILIPKVTRRHRA